MIDGQDRSFDLPAERGQYEERRVYRLDLLERDITKSANRLHRYFAYDRVASGEALCAARRDYKEMTASREIERTFRRAWQELVTGQDGILVELAAHKGDQSLALGSTVLARPAPSEGKRKSVGMQGRFRSVLESYLETRTTTPCGGDTPIAQLFQELAESLRHVPSASGRPTVRVSYRFGKGNWAKVPGAAFLDEGETTTNLDGVYCVYLFRQDMTGVCLSFNQGVTRTKERHGTAEARRMLHERALRLRELCHELQEEQGFSTDEQTMRQTSGFLEGLAGATSIRYVGRARPDGRQAEVLEALPGAPRERKIVEMRYFRPYEPEEPHVRRISPEAPVALRGAWYLLACDGEPGRVPGFSVSTGSSRPGRRRIGRTFPRLSGSRTTLIQSRCNGATTRISRRPSATALGSRVGCGSGTAKRRAINPMARWRLGTGARAPHGPSGNRTLMALMLGPSDLLACVRCLLKHYGQSGSRGDGVH